MKGGLKFVILFLLIVLSFEKRSQRKWKNSLKKAVKSVSNLFKGTDKNSGNNYEPVNIKNVDDNKEVLIQDDIPVEKFDEEGLIKDDIPVEKFDEEVFIEYNNPV